MALCDELEKNIEQSNDSELLMQSVYRKRLRKHSKDFQVGLKVFLLVTTKE